MFRGLATVTLIISVLLMSARLAFTIRLNYLTSLLVFYLLSIIYISPTALLIFEK